jgi:hypothetical protein
VAQIDAIGAGVLRDDEQFAGAGRNQLFRLAQAGIDPAAGEPAAQAGDDAEAARMVAALGNLEVAVVPGRQLDIGLRDQIDEGALAWRGMGVDRGDHLLILVRAGDREHLRMRGADRLGVLAHASRHDHPAVLGNRLADCGQAFLLGRIEKAAGVDQHHVGAGIVLGEGIAVGAQAGEDPLGINQRLGAAEADHADLLLGGQDGGGWAHRGAAPTPACRFALAGGRRNPADA